jgi:hypothetical protein
MFLIADSYTSYVASKNGYLDCLKYVHEQGCPWNILTPAKAAENGHLDCLKYAYENGCPWDERTTERAAENGKLDCLKYAYENGCTITFKATRHALYNNHYDCAEYIIKNEIKNIDNGLYVYYLSELVKKLHIYNDFSLQLLNIIKKLDLSMYFELQQIVNYKTKEFELIQQNLYNNMKLNMFNKIYNILCKLLC